MSTCENCLTAVLYNSCKLTWYSKNCSLHTPQAFAPKFTLAPRRHCYFLTASNATASHDSCWSRFHPPWCHVNQHLYFLFMSPFYCQSVH